MSWYLDKCIKDDARACKALKLLLWKGSTRQIVQKYRRMTLGLGGEGTVSFLVNRH